MTPFYKKLTALDALFATFSDPYGTAKHLLLERGRPPYLLSSLIAIFLALLGPAIGYRFSTDFVSPDQNLTSAISFTAACTTLIFIAFVTTLLKALRIKATFRQVLAISLYSLCPCIPLALGFYVLSYCLDGNWAVVQYLATGSVPGGSLSVELLPFGFLIAALFTIRVFASCIRVLSNGSDATSLLISLVCAAAIYASSLVAMLWVDDLYSGYSEQVATFFRSLLVPTK
jgi:hypothetical protein